MADYTLGNRMLCPTLGSGSDCWMQAALALSGADKVGDSNKYVITIDVNVWMRWVYEYGYSTITLSGTNYASKTVVSSSVIHPASNADYPAIHSYANRNSWLNGGVFTFEVDKASTEQTYSFTVTFANASTNPASTTKTLSIAVPKKKSGVHVQVNGEEKDGMVYVNVGGNWKDKTIVYGKASGAWQEGE